MAAFSKSIMRDGVRSGTVFSETVTDGMSISDAQISNVIFDSILIDGVGIRVMHRKDK